MQNGIPVGLRSSPSFGLSRSGQLTAIIQSLFWDGSQGWWYDDDDPTTLFQDSAGTTPVTAVEQFVGLQLDKSKGLVLGPTVISNGNFSNGTTGWIADSGCTLSASGGVLTVTTTADSAFATQQNNVYVVNKAYQVTFTYSVNNTTTARLRSGATVLWSETGSLTTKTVTAIVFPTTTTFEFGVTGGTVTEFYISNISVRELPGNHRYAPASGNRPIWSKRVNLLTKTEQFNDAVWTKQSSAITVTPNATVAPDGTVTADLFTEDLLNNAKSVYQLSVNQATGYTASVYVKANSGTRFMRLVISSAATDFAYVTVAIADGSITQPASVVGTASNASASVASIGNGWYRISLSATLAAASNFVFLIPLNSGTAAVPTSDYGRASYLGDGSSWYVWGADLRPANQATGLLPLYQRVNTATDYDTNGFPGYLKADGVDDFLQTNSIDFNTVTSDGLPRRNLLVNPTQFDASGWTKPNITITADATTAPDSTSSADLVYPTTTGTFRGVYQSPTTQYLTTAVPKVFSIYAKASGITNIFLFDAFGGLQRTWFDVSAGTVGTVAANHTATIENVGNGWYRCVVTTSIAWPASAILSWGMADSNGSTTATANGTDGVFLWGAQLEFNSTATAFQNIGTDKVTLCAGVRKLSDAAQAVVTELSASIASNNGTFLLAAPDGATNTYGWDSKGTTQVDAVASTFTAPITNVVTGIGNISGDSAIIRVNGVVADTETGDQGTGNYGNLPAYFFHRNTSPATLRFNGYEYGNVAVGKLLTADQLTALETYMNGLTKAY